MVKNVKSKRDLPNYELIAPYEISCWMIMATKMANSVKPDRMTAAYFLSDQSVLFVLPRLLADPLNRCSSMFDSLWFFPENKNKVYISFFMFYERIKYNSSSNLYL